ncbi:putative cell wall glycosyl hydrolase YteR [Phyllosticta capitalensis]
MKSPLTVSLSLLSLLTTPVLSAQPYSTWMASSFLAKGVEKDLGYEQAVLYRAIDKVHTATGNETYATWIDSQLEGLVNDDGSIADWPPEKKSLDDFRMGTVYMLLWERTGEEKWKIAADTLRDRLNIQPRNEEGGFWHRDPDYPNQMWLDGIYMALPLYVHHTRVFAPTNATAFLDVHKQFTLIHKHTYNETTRLLYHGYDGSEPASARRNWSDPETGASPYVWDRALGWWTMAAVDILEELDALLANSSATGDMQQVKSNAADLKAQFQDVMSGVIDVQRVGNTSDTANGWLLLLDPELAEREGNYIESSGSAMFVYSLLKGLRLKYFTGELAQRAKSAGTKGYQGLVQNFVKANATGGYLNWEGTVEVGSLKGDASYEYYTTVPVVENDLKGAGPFILASLEYEAM